MYAHVVRIFGDNHVLGLLLGPNRHKSPKWKRDTLCSLGSSAGLTKNATQKKKERKGEQLPGLDTFDKVKVIKEF